ncbi:MAG: hypothetical protein PVF28_01580 [Thioalkalispiraceae bacterium]|jgi:hypothetical protein
MTEINITLSQLRGMIGQTVTLGDKHYLVIEVLEQSTELVLQVKHPDTYIQPDQHGDAHRRVPTTLTIPVLTADKTGLHPAFLEIDIA